DRRHARLVAADEKGVTLCNGPCSTAPGRNTIAGGVLALVMTIPRCAWCLVAALAGALGASSAGADVFVWVDARGHTNVSNLAPPDDARVTTVIKSVPRTAAQEEAARTAAQRAEMQALADRVTTLQDQLEQSRREAAWMPAAYAPPP